MSKYTSELRFICEQHCLDAYPEEFTLDNIGDKTVFEIATKVASDGYLTKYGNFDFTIFDESYRIPLMTKFIMYYYTREIGLETFGLWKEKVRNKFDLIMPYYNELYKSVLLEYNPLYTEDITEKTDGTRNVDAESHNNGTESHTGNQDSTANGDTWNLYSDTPQGGIYGILNAEQAQVATPSLTDNGYLTNATHIMNNGSQNVKNNGSSSSTNNGTNDVLTTDDYTRKISGYRGYDVNKLVRSFRESIINIDEMIINEFKKFFMLLW